MAIGRKKWRECSANGSKQHAEDNQGDGQIFQPIEFVAGAYG